MLGIAVAASVRLRRIRRLDARNPRRIQRAAEDRTDQGRHQLTQRRTRDRISRRPGNSGTRWELEPDQIEQRVTEREEWIYSTGGLRWSGMVLYRHCPSARDASRFTIQMSFVVPRRPDRDKLPEEIGPSRLVPTADTSA